MSRIAPTPGFLAELRWPSRHLFVVKSDGYTERRGKVSHKGAVGEVTHKGVNRGGEKVGDKGMI